MSDDAAGRFSAVNRISIRAVITKDGEDVSEALLKAGITNPVSIPVVLGDGDLRGGGGGTPNLTGVLEMDAPAGRVDFAADAGEENMPEAPAGTLEVGGGRPVALPPAHGLQPLAPVRRPASGRYVIPGSGALAPLMASADQRAAAEGDLAMSNVDRQLPQNKLVRSAGAALDGGTGSELTGGQSGDGFVIAAAGHRSREPAHLLPARD